MSHIYASGNIAADMTANVMAESTGRVLAVRLYNLTDDPGMKEMLQFLIARDTMHQNQWIAAIAELEADGIESTPAPQSFPQAQEFSEVAYQFWNCSEGTESAEGRWAKGPAPDGKGEFQYLADPQPLGEAVTELAEVDPRVHSTPKVPKPPMTS